VTSTAKSFNFVFGQILTYEVRGIKTYNKNLMMIFFVRGYKTTGYRTSLMRL
jgi:hypothetical protein